MATSAVLIAKPFQAIAETVAPLTGLSANNNKITFLHTVNLDTNSSQQLVNKLCTLKNNNSNLIMLHADTHTTDVANTLLCDASISSSNPVSATANNYRIIYKGDVKIGVITATPEDGDVINQVNRLSSRLKKEQRCNVVVCLSQLGYKNKNLVDDCSLAAATTCVDMIIGGDIKNHFNHPVVILNKDNAEVIVSHVPPGISPFSQIDITFDSMGKKRNISFS